LAQPVKLEDDELLARAFGSKNGEAVRSLFFGDVSRHGDDRSAADLALCSHLAFWTSGDPYRIDCLFRSSDLMRPKWDEPRGAVTYGQLTITKALEGLSDMYSPNVKDADEVHIQTLGASLDHWEQPLPFEDHPVPDFPYEALPSSVRDFALAEATALQVPVDLPAVCALGTAAAACAGRALIRLAPDWTEPLNLYAVVVLPSGERKSPVFRDVTELLQKKERELVASAKPLVAQAEDERDVIEKTLESTKSAAAKGKADERTAAMEHVRELSRALAEHEVPRLPRLLADDVTAEAVASLLVEHQRMAVMSSEGGIFETMAGRYSQGVPNLDVYLKAYSGDTLRVDRKSRPHEYVSSPALTLVLTVQPKVIQDLAAKPGFRGRGLLARFLYSLPISYVGYRSSNSPAVPKNLRRDWESTLFYIMKLPLPPPEEKVRELVLESQAEELFRNYRDEVEIALRLGGDLDGLQDWGNKLPGTAARLTGILHLLKHAEGYNPGDIPICVETLNAAILLGNYFAEHAKAAFALMGGDLAVADAKHVLAWLTGNNLLGFTRSEVWRALRGYFKEVKPLKAALTLLEEHAYIQHISQQRDGPGRPSNLYLVNQLTYTKNGKNGKNYPSSQNSSHFNHFSQGLASGDPGEEEVEWTG